MARGKKQIGDDEEPIHVDKKMDDRGEETNTPQVVASSEYRYLVYDSGRRYIVYIERKICNCDKFQLEEIPCPHIITILKSKNITNMHPYCSDYYKSKALANTYEVPMVPMPDQKYWSVLKEITEKIILPPRYKRMSGRSKKERKKNYSEKLSMSTNCCGHCGHEEHNKRT
ncbi:uncharacterized protein LOC129869860 [Solanum dulcamara]|uniref:uncharacterized protein LOC129869860 n=1 Tax=Solanum dulcamara TaxID=45834 RepID=UPI0024869FFB|nr:uncharacterized protein LOC129869860 [Solanum dulcamara]